ncbi:MAG: PAS domain S-box protein [Ferruginibacter sp.]
MQNGGRHFLKLFHNNLVGMMITNSKHIIVDINDNLLKLTQMSREDVIGKTALEIHILNKKFVQDTWQELSEKKTIQNRELAIVTKNNKTIHSLFSTEEIELDDEQYRLTTVVDISERKKTESALANIYERVTDAFVSINNNWQYTYINKKAGELLEKDPAYLVGKNIWEEFPEDIDQPVYAAYQQAMKRQEVIVMEEYYPSFDRWFQNQIYPSDNGLSVFFSDITIRKKAEARIAESELRFRTLTKHAPVGIFETNADGLTTYVNETWLAYTGLSYDEAMGSGWMHIIHPEDREPQIGGWQNKTKKAESSESEYRIIDKHGKLRWVNGKAIPVIDAAGKVTGYIGTISDVTDLKTALVLLKQSEENLNKAQHISKTGSWEFNLLTRELVWSKEQYRIFELEYLPPEMLYQAYRNKFHPDDLQKLDESINKIFANEDGYDLEHRIICNDGSIKYILGIGEAVKDRDGKLIGVKGTGQDITIRKQAEEILNERTAQLQELSTHLQNIRENERTRIAREIHDELGQQLTALKMDIAWLKRKTTSVDLEIKNKFNDTILLVDETVKSIRRIATELRPSIIDDLGLNAALEWQVTEFSERSGIDIHFNNRFDDKKIDPEISIGLFRILQESLTNIARHSQAKTASIGIEKIKNAVQLSVQDDGIGFDTASKKTKLTFGLLGIKERAVMMNGQCKIISKSGEGTKITVVVPLH